MANIVIIDDDYAQEILAENLSYRGHEVRRLGSASETLRNLEDVLSADLIILDVIMEIPDSLAEEYVSGGRTTGMAIYKKIRERNPDVPILAYSATQDRDLIEVFRDDPNSKFLSKWTTPSMKEIVNTINTMLGIEPTVPQLITFIVHGHNNTAKLELKNYLQNVIGLPEPIILHEQPNLGRTLIKKFEDYALGSNLVFVLLTPDDKIANHDDIDDEKRRARQNVILELGFFLGFLGRESGQVFLLYSGPLELPSDLSGVVYIDISNGIEAAGEQIRKELRNVIH